MEKPGLWMHYVSRVGVDGSWVGATKDNSWFSLPLEPGEHHLCVNLDFESFGNPVEFAHFSAEAGKVYYFRWRLMQSVDLLLAPVDSDEAMHEIETFPLSVSKPK
jgi:hypothetical protein